MKINLGTMSESKFQILKKALVDTNLDGTEILRVDVNSEIDDQPLNLEVTILGAKNRARNAFHQNPEDGAVGLGLEAGLVKFEKEALYNLVCVCAIYTEGKSFLGVTGFIPLPKDTSIKVDNKEEFGVAIREYELKEQLDAKMKKLVTRLISRETDFISAIALALIQFENSKCF